MREVPSLRNTQAAEAQQLKQKALEPQQRQCYIMKKKVSILVEYPDYKGPHFKGPEGAIYCENILECYQKNVRCRYSGISPLFPDPFIPRGDEEGTEDEADQKASSEAEGECEPSNET